MATKQLECRIVIVRHKDKTCSIGMYDPKNQRYEPLGTHGPDNKVIDKVVMDLKTSIEKAGHRLTFCDRSE